MTDLFAPPPSAGTSPADNELFAPPPAGANPPVQQASGGQSDALFAPPKPEELYTPPPSEETRLSADKPDADVYKEMENRSFFDKPALGAEYTTKSEIAQIAQKHGVDPAELEQLAPYFGTRLKDTSFFSPEEQKRAVGTLGSTALLNIPQKLYKKYRGGQMEKALDDLSDLASGRESYVSLIGGAAIPAVGVGGKAASIAGKAAAGAATGAVAGYSGSSNSNEGMGTVFGAGVGAAASALGGYIANKIPNKVEQDLANQVVEREGPRLDKGTEELLAKRASSEQDIKDIYQGSKQLDQDAANRIVNEQLDPELIKLILDPSTEEGKLIRQTLSKSDPNITDFDNAIKQKLADDIVINRAKGFAEELTKERPKTLKDAQDAIASYANREGEEAANNRYDLYKQEQTGLDYIKQSAIRGGRGDNFVDRALNFISDAQFVFRDIDHTFGTSTENIQRDLANSYNKMSFPRNEAREQLGKIFNNNKDIDQVITDTDKLYKALDTGNIDDLTPKEQSALASFKQFFNDGLDYVNNLVKSKDPNIAPLNIPKRDNYVPHMLVDTPELINRVNQKVDQIKDLTEKMFGHKIEDLAQLTPQEFRQLLTSGPMSDLITGLNTFDAKAINNAAVLSARVKDTFATRTGRLNLESKARAALERTGDIPEWMRETNLYKLADRWSTNTLNHLYLRKNMDILRSQSKRIRAAGGELESNYIDNMLGDLNGVRKGTMAEKTRQYGIDYQNKMDKLGEQANNPFSRGAVAVGKALPVMLDDLNKQIYPNLLGLSPRAVIMNATQTLAKTAPELGTRYGYLTLLKGAANAALNSKTIMAEIEKEGLIPAEFVAKYNGAVADGIRRSALYRIPSNMLNGMASAAMSIYSRMDAINRAIVVGTARTMAHDLSKGSGLAADSLKRFPLAIQKQVVNANSEQEVGKIIGNYLNATTQFNYNRASLSEFGRTMGPLFSTFTKWPSATFGDMVQEYRSKGLVKGSLRNAEKYVAPLLLFKAADYLIYGGDPDNMSDRQQLLLGKRGLAGSAPIDTVAGIAKGQFFTPPAVDAVVQALIVPAIQGSDTKTMNGLSSAIQNFTPGSGFVRFLTDDLPTLITGKRPQGENFIERTQSGIERLNK